MTYYMKRKLNNKILTLQICGGVQAFIVQSSRRDVRYATTTNHM
jgi:hypothetical protein